MRFSIASTNKPLPNLTHISFSMLVAERSMSELSSYISVGGSSILRAHTDLYPLYVVSQAKLLNVLRPLVSKSVQVLQLFSLEVRKHKNRIKIFWLQLHFL